MLFAKPTTLPIAGRVPALVLMMALLGLFQLDGLKVDAFGYGCGLCGGEERN